MQSQVSLTDLLHRRTDQLRKVAIRETSAVAAETGSHVYLVGGAVRDLLLGRPVKDLDFVIEGDCQTFASDLATRLGQRFEFHERFQTAEIHLEDLRIDLASARREVYAEPAALPLVHAANLEEDLKRRDFTVNAMALCVWPSGDDRLIDPAGGRLDLEDRLLRVLHDDSFADDPTRILRGLRLASRLGLDWERHTARLVDAAVASGVLERLSSARLRQELVLLFGEEESVDVATRALAARGLLGAVGLASSYDRERFESVSRVRTELEAWAVDPFPLRLLLVRIMILGASSDYLAQQRLVARLGSRASERDLIIGAKTIVEDASRQLGVESLRPHVADRVFGALPSEALAMLALAGDNVVRQWIQIWLTEMRSLCLEVDGEDLLTHGYQPGPEIGRALQATREARLDGRIRVEEEVEFALQVLNDAVDGSDATDDD